MVNLKMIKGMVMVLRNGKMGVNILDNISMTKKMEKGHTNFLMDQNIKDNSKMTKWKVREN